MFKGFKWLVAIAVTGIMLGNGAFAQNVIYDPEYRGTCGLTHVQQFQPEDQTYVSSIRVWYNSQYGGDSLSILLFSPDNDFFLSTKTKIGNCDPNQTQWCEGWFEVDNSLPVGNYFLISESKAICQDPSGNATIVIFGADSNIESQLSPEPIVEPNSSTRQASGLEFDVDRGGSDYKNFDLLSADPLLCQNACLREGKCKAWTYVKPNTQQGVNPRCWLKYRIPDAKKADCCISGFILGE